ncbi:MAG: hypothetical protein NTY39_11800 [Campylobacterales bacterium]|nr:hypothetical protein [Campylobacterales bacterium]
MSTLKGAITMVMSQKIKTFLYQNLGWKIEMDTQSFESKISHVFKELECTEADSCLEFIENHQSNTAVIQAFAREFSVGESYFFRDTHFFDQLEHHIIPQIREKNERRLAIWSVGCSRGEELYSVAMLLQRMIPYIETWNLYLLGTDVNPYALGSAKEGVFNQYSLRKIPESYMRYFKPLQESYELHPKIKKMVHFKYHNIMSDPSACLPSDGRGFDLILLNNVLIYFELQKAKEAVERLFSVIKEGGWLATTATEYSMGIFDFPHSQCLNGDYIIQKVSKPPLSAIAISDEKDESYLYEEVITPVLQAAQRDETLITDNTQYTYYHNALKMVESGDKEGAKVSLRRALYLDGSLVMAHIVLGNILKKEGKFEAAIKHINNAKVALQRMEAQEEVELSDGMRASDLLTMLDAIQGKNFE